MGRISKSWAGGVEGQGHPRKREQLVGEPWEETGLGVKEGSHSQEGALKRSVTIATFQKTHFGARLKLMRAGVGGILSGPPCT